MTFAEQNLRLASGVRRITEPRRAWEIPLFQMIGLFLHAAVWGEESLHRIDQIARTGEARAFCGSRRPMVVSDSTYQRVFPHVQVHQVAALQRQIAAGVGQMGCQRVELPGSRRVRAASVDGTVLSGRFVSVLDLLGAVDSLVDLEPYAQKGDELPATQRLLRRHVQVAGRGFVDYLLGDGLYITQGMLRLSIEELDVHLVVKTTEVDTLNILKDANALFDSAEPFAEVEHRCGVDEERTVAYEIWAAAGFEHQGVPDLKVARVTERHPKTPGQAPETFWVVATDPGLTAEAMRELAKKRWSIENRGFRALNALAASKHQWVRPCEESEPPANRELIEAYFQVVVRLLMVAYMLVQAFAAAQEDGQLRQAYGGLRLTIRFIGQRLLQTMGQARMATAETPEG